MQFLPAQMVSKYPLLSASFYLRHMRKNPKPVHFLRFELDPSMIAAARAGDPISAGVDHAAYSIASFEITAEIRDSLSADLDQVAIS